MAISIIIPVLNDASALRRCLAAITAQSSTAATQIIVVDGGNDSECEKAARELNARYLNAPRGRAVQMNAGAREAQGELLWFLHADCTPAPGSIEALSDLNPNVKWGCFRHRLDAPSILLRLIERADNFRARWLRLPYGDQGIFVRRDAFDTIGGYEPVPLLEDVILVRSLARQTAPCVLRPFLCSDARRWLERGILRTTLMNWKIMWLYFWSRRKPDELAALYRGKLKESAKQA